MDMDMDMEGERQREKEREKDRRGSLCTSNWYPRGGEIRFRLRHQLRPERRHRKAGGAFESKRPTGPTSRHMAPPEREAETQAQGNWFQNLFAPTPQKETSASRSEDIKEQQVHQVIFSLPPPPTPDGKKPTSKVTEEADAAPCETWPAPS